MNVGVQKLIFGGRKFAAGELLDKHRDAVICAINKTHGPNCSSTIQIQLL